MMDAPTVLIRRTRTNRYRWLAFLGAALLATTWAAGSANATIIDRSSFSEPYEFTSWDCGYPMQVKGVVSDKVQVRADKKNADIVYVTTRHDFKETWTAGDGRWFTLSGHNLYKDIKAKKVAGQLYQFTFHIPGQPFTVTNSSGKVVSKDRGNVSFEYTIDFADGTFTDLGVRLSGPHPSAGVDTCLIVAPLTGGDSARHLTPRPIGSTDFPMGFYEYLPPSYGATGAKSPLLLFFNGYGENGDGSPEGLSNLLNAGIPKYINVGGWATNRPFVVLALQHVEDPPGFDGSACEGVEWGGSCNMQIQHDRLNAQPAFCTTPDEVHDFIDYAVVHYNVDPGRVYVTGLSCGAFGIWEYLAKYPADGKVAAAVPIAGDGRPGSSADYCALAPTPLWAFHGALDDVVNPLGSIEPMNGLADCHVVPPEQAKLTVYPDRDHNSWDPAYGGANGEDIYSWMLGFSKP
jgi:dienelactone hydrolase